MPLRIPSGAGSRRSLLDGVTRADTYDPDAPLEDAFLAGGYRGL